MYDKSLMHVVTQPDCIALADGANTSAYNT